jgi:hypothetical protein
LAAAAVCFFTGVRAFGLAPAVFTGVFVALAPCFPSGCFAGFLTGALADFFTGCLTGFATALLPPRALGGAQNLAVPVGQDVIVASSLVTT